MQKREFKKDGEILIIQWDEKGEIGICQNGKVWINMENPELLPVPSDEQIRIMIKNAEKINEELEKKKSQKNLMFKKFSNN